MPARPNAEVLSHRGKLNALYRCRPPGDPAITVAARDLAAAGLAAHVQKIIDAAPPFTDEQRARITALLAPVDGTASQ